jgi:hypothetical protein
LKWRSGSLGPAAGGTKAPERAPQDSFCLFLFAFACR